MKRNRLYIFLAASCLAGYFWIAASTLPDMQGLCVIKHMTGIPCPSCGSTRSVLSLVHGDFAGSLLWNPLGLILAAMLVILPLWILFDTITGRSSLLKFYSNTEVLLRKKHIAIPGILFLAANWAWNIYKGL